jgi:hypothetical protein
MEGDYALDEIVKEKLLHKALWLRGLSSGVRVTGECLRMGEMFLL